MVNGKHIAVLAWMFLAFSASSEASSMRCGTSIVSEGDTMQQVLDKCGAPISKEVWQPKLRVNGVPEKVPQSWSSGHTAHQGAFTESSVSLMTAW
jgi:hypothetical protein